MKTTQTLIEQLSGEASLPTKPRSPRYWAVRLLVVLALYGVGAQFYLGLRPDLAMQCTRTLFVIEIALLAALLLASALASLLAMAPDAYQKTALLRLPYAIFATLVAIVAYQWFLPLDARMVMPEASGHHMECALFIAAAALLPSAMIFALLRKGASVRPLQAGAFAVLTAGSIGALTLRLAEANDSIMHLAGWHYLPTFFFAAIGALLGKQLLKW
jgi:hypothetical protein